MTDTPSSLARELFGRTQAWEGQPFWADGGPGGRHVLAALPDWVRRVNVDTLEPRELLTWLRGQLESIDDEGALHVVALAYDAGRNLEVVPTKTPRDLPIPDVVVARYPAHWVIDGDGAPELKGASDAKKRLRAWRCAGEPSSTQPQTEDLAWSAADVASSLDSESYRQAVARILDGVAAGDFYEVNLARRLTVPFPAAKTFEFYKALRARTKAPFGALWALDENTWMASGSPECLFTWSPDTREIHSYPIKGTRPRRPDPGLDAAMAANLITSEKDRAEHVMIVDLVRNDLGRIAKPGSVVVHDLFGIHSFETVHHLITDVQATAADTVDVVDVIGALFPGGSITGAPKIAAMEVIERLEGVRRGWYCGSLGVIDRGGQAVFNILIRTAVAAQGTLSYATGGAIVADSDAAEEWAETETKAAAFRQALAAVVGPAEG